MAFSFRIYERRKAGETVGRLSKAIELSATEADAAVQESHQHIGEVNFVTHFAALMGSDDKFVTFWANRPW